MKSTRWLVLVAPLLIVSLANAATPVPDASVVLPAAITAPAGISPACAARASQAKLPILNPAAVPATVQHCGGCSIVVCQALIVGSDCGDGRTCQQVGSDCTEDGRPNCTCS
jgi:hypothetical protein